MDDNVVGFPGSEAPNVWGSMISGHSVIIEGRQMPRMLIKPSPRGVEVILDGRWSYEFSENVAYLALHFASNAMAIGAGFACLSSESKGMPFAPQVAEIAL